MASRLTIAAVVLNYRTATHAVAAVRSLQKSAVVGRVIVVDNASGDGSADRLTSELQGVEVLRAPRNSGFSAGCNIGIRQALQVAADGVLILNADAFILDAAVSVMERASRSAGIVGPLLVNHANRIESCGMTYSAQTGRMRHLLSGASRSAATVPKLADVDAVSGAAMLIRREVFETIGLFNEEYFYGFEDLEFCLRAKAAGFRIVCTGSAVVEHEGAASIGRSSPRRLYFAARNHLLLATRVGPQAWPIRTARAAHIVALNVAHAVLRSGVPTAEGLRAVSRGVRDHWRGRYGADETPPT